MAAELTCCGTKERRDGPMMFLESAAPLDSPIVFEPIPPDLSWKFLSNPDPKAPRYWVKLKSMGKETCVADQHKQNVDLLKEELATLIKSSSSQCEYTLWCEARYGKADWRTCENDLNKNLCIKDVPNIRNREFYVRTTTRTEDMIKSLCSIPDEEPRDSVVLTVQDINDGSKYKISFDENPRGEFIFNEDEAFDHYSKHLGKVTADFICIGRSYDVRISTTCKYQVSSSSKPTQVIQDVRKIADSVHRADNGKLKMVLKSGCVEVKFIRQMKRWNVTLKERHHGVNLYEVKETNTDTLHLVLDEVVELDYHDNREIEVKVIKDVKGDHKIDDMLKEVEDLIDYAMDMVEKMEKCKDPDIPF